MTSSRGLCSIDECNEPHSARGYCRQHYRKWQRHGDPLHEVVTAASQKCWIEDCNSIVGLKGAKGLCTRHYQRMLASGSPTGSTAPTIEQRFFAKVVEQDGCWLWTAALDQSGYGLFSGRPGGVSIRAHIWSYEFFVGEIPPGLELDHLCHTADKSCMGGGFDIHRRCCNPEHLEPVSSLVNAQRGRGAKRSHCPQGHLYSIENTYLNPKGAQVCRICRKNEMESR
jgi:hypothetical protein